MIRRSTWIVLAIFFILLVAVILLQRSGDFEETSPTPTGDLTVPLFTHSASDDVVELSLQSDMNQLVEIQRTNSSNAWSLVTPFSNHVDESRIDTEVGRLSSVVIESELDDDTPLSVIGLDTPAYTLTIGTKGGGQSVVYIGDETITGNGYYAQVDKGSPIVVTKSGMDAVIGFIQDPPILPPTETPEPTSSETDER